MQRLSRGRSAYGHLRQSRTALLMVALMACGDPTGGEVPARLTLPLRDRIVFGSNRADSLYDIFALRTDGSDPRRLTESGTADLCPSLSPDGNWIAYFRKDPQSATVSFALQLDRLSQASDSLVLLPGGRTAVESCAAVCRIPLRLVRIGSSPSGLHPERKGERNGYVTNDSPARRWHCAWPIRDHISAELLRWSCSFPSDLGRQEAVRRLPQRQNCP